MKFLLNDIADKIEPFIFESINSDFVEVVEKDAIDFLTSDRIDVAAKLLFIDYLNCSVDFYRDVYKDHLRVITLGSFKEYGSLTKHSYLDFEEEYKSIVNSIYEKGFSIDQSIIPLALNGSIANGAHRLAASIYHGKKVSIINTNSISQNFNYDFFFKRGMPRLFVEAMCKKYTDIQKNVRLAVVWPVAQGKESEIEDILGEILYSNCINVSRNSLHTIVCEVYKDEVWLGNISDRFIGAMGKVIPCYLKNSPLRLYLFQSDSNETVLEKKEAIRSLYSIDKHSVHMTDTHEDTVRLVKFFLNPNFQFHIDHLDPFKFSSIHNLISSFKKTISDNNLEIDRFVIGGSALISLLGARKANDLDFISDIDENILTGITANEGISLHNSELNYYDMTVRDLLYDPRNYFYYQGVKFLSIERLTLMKVRRGEVKDRNDLIYLYNLEKNNWLLKTKVNLINSILFFKVKTFYFTIQLLQRVGLYTVIRFFYRIIKSKK